MPLKSSSDGVTIDVSSYKNIWLTFFANQGFNMRMKFVWCANIVTFFITPILENNQDSNFKYNYVWRSAIYNGGDDIIRPFDGSYNDFLMINPSAYDLCIKNVRHMCGPNVTFSNN